ncbi:MAG: bifunctional proline dehydrogenase/L-glutamate gamma-semialdehyde dehydrogenase PutA, partial [Pseudomonadota bacterium]
MPDLDRLRTAIRKATFRSEDDCLRDAIAQSAITPDLRSRAQARATDLVVAIREDDSPGLMEVFLAEYGLSTQEGVALMCLAEVLLRVPDAETIDALIEDKIAPGEWSAHLGRSSSALVNASTWALMITGEALTEGRGAGVAAVLRDVVKRLGEPMIRIAVKSAMKALGGQFVLGETIDEALSRGRDKAALGYAFSFDMLGEAALTADDAQSYFDAYAAAIDRLSRDCVGAEVRRNPGVSIKLSALHPRYEHGQRARVLAELTPRVARLARMARDAGMGLNLDAEEADRLDLSLDVAEAMLTDPDLAGWDGFGMVVQAYGKRAAPAIDWLYAAAAAQGSEIMVRLVKGAYWDAEIKRAQIDGLADFPVFTRKAATDVNYLCCAQKLLSMRDRIYPQFATHNAHSVAAILEMADGAEDFELQRLHGMGEALHDRIVAQGTARSRIYAPVGPHRDLLAYLVRRLLENGANSSFVNQIVDKSVHPATVARDPFDEVATAEAVVAEPRALYAPERPAARGVDLRDPVDLAAFDARRAAFRTASWTVAPMLATAATGAVRQEIRNPADDDDLVGVATLASAQDVRRALSDAAPWAAPAATRTRILNAAADLYEDNAGELWALLAREAGKTPPDAVGELREAVDFLRYYGARAADDAPARGVIGCVSPWNFPLAIFTGQIAAVLAAGGGVLAKPAEPTPLIAGVAVALLRSAGVPDTALQLAPGAGATIGAQLVAAPEISGVCFTGSTATAQAINRAMAETVEPVAPLIAETGGVNAMIVDSTALPEQAVKDILASAFQSAGQRCSALRILCLQEDVAERMLAMLFGAMDELAVGDPWSAATDVGPIIHDTARGALRVYIDAARADGRVLKECAAPAAGCFIGPTVIRVDGVADMRREMFGPILHVATFRAEELADVVDAINATGYGLTFGMHSRIDDRVQLVSSRIAAGNIYVNRNQIGAVVGTQPFGGEALSGTGPKAGGPRYVTRFKRPQRRMSAAPGGRTADLTAVAAALRAAAPSRARLSTRTLPGPVGESNQLNEYGRGTLLCLGPTRADALRQAEIAADNGCAAVSVAPGLRPDEGLDGVLPAEALATLNGFFAV